MGQPVWSTAGACPVGRGTSHVGLDISEMGRKVSEAAFSRLLCLESGGAQTLHVVPWHGWGVSER